MPRLIQPDLPPQVEMAVAFIGNRAQADISRVLSMGGPSTIGSLLERLDVGRPSLNRHLATMEKMGVVVGDPPLGGRHGKSVVYEIVPARVNELAEEYLRYVTGEEPGGG